MRKVTLLFLLIHFVLGVNLAQESKSLFQYEFTSSIGNSQIFKGSNSYMYPSYKHLTKTFRSGLAVDFGVNVTLPLGKNRFKTGIHLNNWRSKVRLESQASEELLSEEGTLSVSRITVPIIYRIGKTNSQDFLNLQHEIGILVDYNLNFASSYFNIRYYERSMSQDLFLEKPDYAKTRPNIRFQYGVSSNLNEKLSINIKANVGFSEILVSGANCIFCGTGLTTEQLVELSRSVSFKKIPVLGTSIGMSYRMIN